MSYGPPPTKTPYGDQDFIKEDWAPNPINDFQQQQQQHPQRPRPPHMQTESQNPRMPPGPNDPAPNQNNPMNQYLSVAKSITQQDMLFLRAWRQDSFYYRVLPLAASSWGGLYYYNKVKNLPHKPTRYFLLTGLAYVLGKWSYRGEFIRRLAESPLNTPFMRAMRQSMGVPQRIDSSDFPGDQNPEFSTNYSRDTSGWGQTDPSSPQLPHSSLSYPTHPLPEHPIPYNSFQSNEPDNSLTSQQKPATTYEELRARNRGYRS